MNASASVLNSLLSTFDRALPAHVRAQPKQLRAARHLTLLAALTAASVPLLTLMYHLIGYDAASTMVMTAGIVMMIAPFAMGAGCSLAVSRDLFIGALYILKVWMAIHLGGIAAPTVPWFLLCPLIALLLGGLAPGLLWGAIVMVTVASLFFIEQSGTPFVAHAVTNQPVLVLVSVVGLLVFATIIAICFFSNAEALDQRPQK